MYEQNFWLWAGFLAFVAVMLAIDIGLFHRRPHVVRMREALSWTAVWIGLALLFNAGILYFWGTQAAAEFLTGYLVEKSLSIDNVFVFLLVFSYFKTPPAYQHKVLFWGIIGAILARSVFIVAGLALLERFHWTIYVFGSFLLVTGIWMFFRNDQQIDPERNPVIRFVRRRFPVTDRYESDRFVVRHDGRLLATPLLLVLLAVESSDIVFAIDSIPAIFAVTQDPFIVYTSNVFAMLGLRAMYFAVAGLMRLFHYLHYGFASIILILGVKMLLSDVYHLPVAVSLALVVFILLVSMVLSLLRPRGEDLRRLLERSQHRGLITFRRLLLLENVFDLGSRRVRDAMRPKAQVRILDARAPWPHNHATMTESRLSRYPLIAAGSARPLGLVHVKDLFHRGVRPHSPEAWAAVTRPALTTREDALLEDLLVDFQRQRGHMALVFDARGAWTGTIALEDVIESIVGRVTDEFEASADASVVEIAPERVVLSLDAEALPAAAAEVIRRSALVERREPLAQQVLADAPASRFRLAGGVGFLLVEASAARQPLLFFGRSDGGLDTGGDDRAHALLLLVVPPGLGDASTAMATLVLTLLRSDSIRARLLDAEREDDVVVALREGARTATGYVVQEAPLAARA